MKKSSCIFAVIWLILAGICTLINIDVGFIIMYCTLSIIHVVIGMALLIKEEIKNINESNH